MKINYINTPLCMGLIAVQFLFSPLRLPVEAASIPNVQIHYVPFYPEERQNLWQAAGFQNQVENMEEENRADSDSSEVKVSSSEIAESPIDLEDTAVVSAIPNTGRIIWTGDSRTVQMELFMEYQPDIRAGYEDVYICKGAEGYAWFEKEAIPAINEILADGDVIVVNFGINDLANLTKYINKLNELVYAGGAWYGHHVVYMSVNPVDESKTTIRNSRIEAFNNGLQQGLDSSITYLDTYTPLMNSAFIWQEMDEEGVHYSNSWGSNNQTYPFLYQMVRNLEFEYSPSSNNSQAGLYSPIMD